MSFKIKNLKTLNFSIIQYLSVLEYIHKTKLISYIQFQNQILGVHERQATSLDPLNRLLQEKAIEAIFDAGLQPSDFENTKTGIYIGGSYSESEIHWLWDRSCETKFYVFTG